MTAVPPELTQTANPLLELGFQIPFDRIRPEHAGPAVDQLIAQARAALEELATPVSAGRPDFLERLDALSAQLDEVNTVIDHLNATVSSDDWRAAQAALLPEISAFYTDQGLHPGLWQALLAFGESEHAARLDPVWARYLELTTDEFRRGGAELAPEQKERLKAINVALAELTHRYRSQAMDGLSAYELYVPAGRLAGLPARVLEATARDAEAHGRAGLHRLTLQAPTYLPVLTYADDRTLREELARAWNAVGTGEGRDNRELLPEILALRRERAELLGYASFADLILADRMAGSGERAARFENDLEARTRPAFEREARELETFYRARAGEDAPTLASWDLAYWAEKQRLALYAFDEEELRPYFPLDGVLDGLFEITRRIFGVRVSPAQAPVWHPEARYYDVHSDVDGQAGEHLASFYADWFPRETKRGGAWMNPLYTAPRGGGGPRQPHLGLMCGNMTRPSGEMPALLSHEEVQTVFHEFGHLLHHALSEVPVRSLSGTSVPWDFVELPSQILENWAWNEEALSLFARHYRGGEALPGPLLEKMLAARNYQAASAAMRQYSLGTLDLALHQDYRPSQGEVSAYARELLARFSAVPPLPDNALVANFSHIFASPVGYAAGYYSYKWAEVLDADAFSRFEEGGVMNPEVGRAFVGAVLLRGNGAAPAELFREFLGRDPDPSALLRRSGLGD